MTPYWLLRLNDLLAWLNPALGCVAAVLALMVIGVAAERASGQPAAPAIQVTRPAVAASSAECPQMALPRELRDLRLYD